MPCLTLSRNCHPTGRRHMTTLDNRPNTALLVIDMQRDVVGQAYEVDRVVKNINGLIDKARSESVAAIWVQHSDDEERPQGSAGGESVPGLEPQEGEPLVHKRY